jgi:hypothetical protein
VAVTPISDGLARAEVRYGFMERPEHSEGAGAGGGARGRLNFMEGALALASRIAGFLPPRPETFADAALRVAASAFLFGQFIKKPLACVVIGLR